MERGLFRMLRAELRRIGRRRTDRRQTHTDATIVEVYFWAVLHDRPVSWACRPENWPGVARRGPLPSQSAMSRRLRTAGVRRLIDTVERRLRRSDRPAPLVFMIDGKPLPVSAHSKDPHAAWGRGSGGLCNGYKLHLLMAIDGTVLAWRVAPMNVDERAMARRLLRDARCAGYVLADANYDASHLHDLALAFGGQLVTPRRVRTVNQGLGHHPQSPGRLRSIDLLENTVSSFGRDLHALRNAIERKFGYLASTAGLLTHLPAWVRTCPRVRLWVQAKLVIADLRIAATRISNTSAA